MLSSRAGVRALFVFIVLYMTYQSWSRSRELLEVEMFSDPTVYLSMIQHHSELPSLLGSGIDNTTIINPHTWENQHGFVHVVYSRFMQHQPNLLDLGRARLILFRTFAAATMSQQTTQDFLWIIQVDPDLHPILLHGLLEALQVMPRPNVVVLASNQVLKGSHDGGFRGQAAMSNVSQETIRYGSLGLMQSYHQAAQTHVVLETTLDVDDGLNVDYLRQVQLQTVDKLGAGGVLGMVWCIPHVLEWQYYNKWDNTSYTGILGPASAHVCLTPGLTWVTRPHGNVTFIKGHHKVFRLMPECHQSVTRVHVDGQLFGCYQKVSMSRTSRAAIRARTPTSSGMNGVQGLREVAKKNIQRNKEHWNRLGPDFGIPVGSVLQARRDIEERLSFLFEDALEGMCTPDHTCVDSIKDQLLTLKEKEAQRRQQPTNETSTE